MPSGKSYRFGRYRLHSSGGLLYCEDSLIPLAPKVAQTLLLLVENAGDVVEKEELLKKVWQDAIIEEGSLTRTISVLRKALRESDEGREYIATLSKRGYRFVAPVTEIAKPHVPSTIEKIMLAVLPFENLSGDQEQEYFSDGLTEEMITQLGRLNPDRLGVIARTSAMRYKTTDKSVAQIGRELGVVYVLEGSVRRAGGRVRIAAQLIQVADQTHLWAENYERELGDILDLQSQVAQTIARQIQLELATGERVRMASLGPVNPEAYEACLRGRYLWNKRTPEALQRSVQQFEKAIQYDPRYAPAYAGLADSYLTLLDEGLLPPRKATCKAKAAADKALQIDEKLAEAHNSLAHAHFHELDWSAAERDFKRGLDLNPSCTTAHFYYANYLVVMGRPDEAITEARCAQLLDPVSLPAEQNLASIFYHAQRYKQAIEQCLKILEIDPTFSRAYEDLGRAYEQQERYKDAIAAFRKAMTLSGRSPRYMTSLAHAYAVAGRRKEAIKLLQELRRMSKKRYVSSCAFALVSVGLGKKAETFAWLAKACQERSSELPFLKVNPRLAPLHSDPRYHKLLRRLHLSP